MAADHYARKTRAQLIAELHRLEAAVGDSQRLEALLHEQTVHQEEILTQHEELTEAKRALEASRDRYAELFDLAPIGYAALDAYGVVEDMNLAAATLLEVERNHVLGMPLIH